MDRDRYTDVHTVYVSLSVPVPVPVSVSVSVSVSVPVSRNTPPLMYVHPVVYT